MMPRTPRLSGRGHRPASCRPELEVLEGRCLPCALPVFRFSTGNPDGRMATASRPATGTAFGIESADDFVLPTETVLNSATFTGLVPAGSTVSRVVVEIYRVFPRDSDTGRTSGPPGFTPQVPTRASSPSDIVFNSRDSGPGGGLTFTTGTLSPSFTASNSIQPGGIHPIPNQTTGGDGPVSGQEVEFDVIFTTPFDLPADHYFFVPQVLLSTGNFLWLSAPQPIMAPGTPFTPFTPDLESWTRDANLNPDWLRVGTDVVGGNPAPTFNAAFSLFGFPLTTTIFSLSPTSAIEGDPGFFTLTVNGTNFTPGSTVLFNGTPLGAAFVSASQLTTAVPKSLLAEEGTALISVFDTQRGISNAVTFTITDSTPLLSNVSLSQAGSRFAATVTGSFADQGVESHRVVIDWGDGTSDTLDFGPSRGSPFSLAHRYLRRNRHRRLTIRVTALDDEGTPSSTQTFSVRVGR